MKKCLLVALFLVFALGRMCAQEIIIGTGTSSSASPAFSPSYTDSWWESTFLASEVNVSGSILSISLQSNEGTLQCEDVNIYMGHRESPDYNTTSNFTPMSDLTLVYSGTSMTLGGANGWEEFQLQTPFEYNGIDNLVVVFAKHATTYSTSLKYYYSSLTSYPSIYRRIDNNISYSQHPGSNTGTTIHWRPNVKLVFGNAGCVLPLNVQASGFTESGCTIAWLPAENGGYYNYQLKAQGNSWDNATTASTYDTSVTLSNLIPSTTYNFRVRNDCGDTVSAWVDLTFTTLHEPASLPYDCDFSDADENAKWVLTASNNNHWTIGTGTSYVNDGIDKALYVSNNAAGAYAADFLAGSFLFAERVIDFGETPGTYELTFDWKASGVVEGSTVYSGVMVFLLDADVETQPVFPSYVNESLTFGAQLSDWSHVTTQLTDVSGYKKLQFFTWGYDYSQSLSVPAAVDNILISESGCVTPTMTFETGAQSVIITHDGPSDGLYYLQYRVFGVTDMQDTTFTGSTLTIDNLQMNTSYIAWIVQICGTDTSSVNEGATFSTTCGTAVVTNSFPWTETFTNAPDCWNLAAGTSNWTYFSNSYLRHGYGFYSCDAVTPVIDVSAVTIPCVKFDEQRPDYENSGVADHLQVFYRTIDGYDTSAWVLLATYTDVTNSFRSDTLVLPASLSLFQLKFTATGMGDEANGCSLDNVQVYDFGVMDGCMAPVALSVSNVTTASAELGWMLVSDGIVNLHYKSASDPAYTVVEDVTTDEGTYLVENLAAATEYVWFLTLLCNGDTVVTPEFTFFTACGQMEVPYLQDFDSYEQLTIPQCWSRINAYIGYPQINTGSAHSGNNALKFICNPYGNAPIYVAMPEFGANFQELQVNFWTRREGANSGILSVGYVTDPADASTFVSLMSISSNQIGDDDYHNYLVKFDSVTVSDTMHYYITFKYEQTENWYWFVDDIQVSIIPPCLEPEPVSANNITFSSADLTWTDVADNYVVFYKAEGDSVYSEVNGVTMTSGAYTLNDLDAGTRYEWYVASLCPDGSLASSFTTHYFVTQCHAISNFPVSWDFEIDLYEGTLSYPLPLCWSRIAPAGPSAQYPYVTSVGDNALSGTHSLIFYNMYAEAYGVLPEIDSAALSIQDVQLTFYAKTSFSTPATLEVGVMTDPTDITTFVPVQTISPSSAYPVEPYEVTFFTYTGNGRHIAIRNVSPPDVTASFYIDDVTVEEAPACARPLNLTATASTMSSVTLSWVAAPGQTEWEIAYGDFGFSPDNAPQVVTANTNPFEVTGLDGSTTYVFYVRALCASSEVSNWSYAASGATSCGYTPVPYLEDFDSYQGTTYEDNNGIAPSCWTTYGTNTYYGAPHITSYGNYHYTNSGANSMVFTSGIAGSDSYAALPTFTEDLNTLELTFWYAMASAFHGTLSVGYVTDLSNMDATFVPLLTIPSVAPSEGTTFTVDFVGEEIPASGNICFRWNCFESYYSCCIDDIAVYLSDTPGPVTPCNVPTGLHTSGIQNESVTIAWDANANVSSWNIRYRVANASTWSTATSNTNSYTVTGLTGLTNYELQVQADCGNGNVSDWSQSATAQTTNVGIANRLESRVVLFPNPAKEVVHVQCTMNNVQMSGELHVFDVYGKLVQIVPVTSDITPINVSGLADGMYFVRVTAEQGAVTKSFVKR